MKMNNTTISILAIFATCALQPVFAEDSSVGFEAMDTDADGSISSLEARANSKLDAQWKKLDTDSDGKLDESEFSAFEAMDAETAEGSKSEPAK